MFDRILIFELNTLITFLVESKVFRSLFFLVSRKFDLLMDLLGFNLGVTKDGEVLI